MDLAKIREVAERATPGPWEIEENEWGIGSGIVYCDDITGSAIANCNVTAACRNDLNIKNNAQFIATCNPQTVLALLAHIDRLTKIKQAAEQDIEDCDGRCDTGCSCNHAKTCAMLTECDEQEAQHHED